MGLSRSDLAARFSWTNDANVDFAAVFQPAVCLAAALYLLTLVLWLYNARRQFIEPLYSRLRKEMPLDDAVHAVSPMWLAAGPFRTLVDMLLVAGPTAVLLLEFSGGYEAARRIAPLELMLEFGAISVYKQIVCMVTRLPPAVQTDNTRTVLGFPVATWIDYGISGHTAVPVLLFLHLPSATSLVLALVQSVMMTATRDHYTLDVLHAWVFCLAVAGRLTPLCEVTWV